MKIENSGNQVERWGVFEISLEGPADGNPFLEQSVKGTFSGKCEVKTVDGFYDGDGIYKIRFMPSFCGEYSFSIEASFLEAAVEGNFTSIEPSKENHGPVHVVNTYYFSYADGTPYHSIGTTCYVWNLQPIEQQEKTLRTLTENSFNKIRFCIFPKHYDYNFNEPITYPFEGTPCDNSKITKENFNDFTGKFDGNNWDFSRFRPEHFQLIEKRILDLQKLGIEADLILFHPYDRWGFSAMDAETDDRYLKYVVARFSALRNVWWSLANEYDIMRKTPEDWERYASIICEKDAYNHLRSIHNCIAFYDHKKPWVTHCSIQRQDLYKTSEFTDEWRKTYGKPVVLDEIAYEGNIQHGWGNISGEEMTRRFWEAFLRGGFPGHGETYLNLDGILWWSHGGELHGTSPKRIAFMAKIMQETPGCGMERFSYFWDALCSRAVGTSSEIAENKSGTESKDGKPTETGNAHSEAECKSENNGSGFLPRNDYFIFYFGFMRPSFREFYFDDETPYKVEVIDTWNMTIENQDVKRGKFTVNLPGREYMAIRVKKDFGAEG